MGKVSLCCIMLEAGERHSRWITARAHKGDNCFFHTKWPVNTCVTSTFGHVPIDNRLFNVFLADPASFKSKDRVPIIIAISIVIANK